MYLHGYLHIRDRGGQCAPPPQRPKNLDAGATTPGHALSVKYDEKLNGAEELCRRQGMAFFPLAAETFGG